MSFQEKCEALNSFQNDAFKTHNTLGFQADSSNLIFGIIIQMRNLVTAAEKQDTILLHKYMGDCAWYVVNYASINNLKMDSILGAYTYPELDFQLESIQLEDYLQKIKDDLSFVEEMNESDKQEFIQKCWISIFPQSYFEDFIKIDRILKSNTKDNKVKFPQKFIP